MPASICLYCRIIYRPGLLPGSHGICSACLDPEDAEKETGEVGRRWRHPVEPVRNAYKLEDRCVAEDGTTGPT